MNFYSKKVQTSSSSLLSVFLGLDFDTGWLSDGGSSAITSIASGSLSAVSGESLLLAGTGAGASSSNNNFAHNVQKY